MGNNWIEKIQYQLRIADTAQRLIYFIAAISLIEMLMGNFLPVNQWVALNADMSVNLPKFWTYFTYTFFHANIIHLIFNLIALYYFGQLFNTFFTQRQLLAVFILGSLFAGLFFVALFSIIGEGGQLLGASGGIMALLFAVARYSPHMLVRLPLIGQVKIWYIAAGFLLLDLLLMMSNGNVGGRLAHIGGALFGVLYATLLLKGTDMSQWIFWNKPKFANKKSTRTSQSNAYTERYSKADNQKKVNEILDKIRISGYESLTKKEKEFLFKQK